MFTNRVQLQGGCRPPRAFIFLAVAKFLGAAVAEK